jgi:ribosomal protein L12E/L44/L45/RPP1/RPP2
MSEPLAPTLKALEEIQKQVSSLKLKEDEARGVSTRLQKVTNTVEENKTKIWLRTRAGKEMVEAIQRAAEELLGVLGSGSGKDEALTALVALEAQAARVDEESRRRSMVVT